MTNDDRIGQEYAEADHTVPGLMRWHYRKRPDTVARIRQLPLSLSIECNLIPTCALY